MATRLFSDIRDASGRRYYYDLDSSPGVVSPGIATLTLTGYGVFYPETIFRTPATTTLTLFGRDAGPDVQLRPAQAALAFNYAAVGLQIERTIRLELASPVESPPSEFTPTLVTQMLVVPAQAALSMLGLGAALSQGGNIGFISPDPAALSLLGYQYFRALPPEESVPLVLVGLAPSLLAELVVSPEAAVLAFGSALQTGVTKGFTWIDDDPSPTINWG